MNSLTNKDGQELITESQCIVVNSEHYVRVDWYAEDPHPEEPEFETDEFGMVPKQMAYLDGVHCVRTDMSIFSLS